MGRLALAFLALLVPACTTTKGATTPSSTPAVHAEPTPGERGGAEFSETSRALPPVLVSARFDDEGRLGPYDVASMVRGGDDDWTEVYRYDAIDHVAALEDLAALFDVADDAGARWLVVPLLQRRYAAGERTQIEAVAASAASPAGRRVVAMIAMFADGVRVADEPLVAIADRAADPETRMAAVSMLGVSTTSAARTQILARLQDRNERVRQSAALAAGQQRNLEAVPLLARLMVERADNRIYISALGELGSADAATALIASLRTTVEDRPQSDAVYRLQSALANALPVRFAEAGAHDVRYYERVGRATLLWWDEIRGHPLEEVRPALHRMARVAPVETSLRLLAEEGSGPSLSLIVELIEADYGARPASYAFLAKVRILSEVTGEQFEPPHAGPIPEQRMSRHTASTMARVRRWSSRQH